MPDHSSRTDSAQSDCRSIALEASGHAQLSPAIWSSQVGRWMAHRTIWWKGHRRETHGVHDQQALVLVHLECAKGTEIWPWLRHHCLSSPNIWSEFEPEVNQIGLATA